MTSILFAALFGALAGTLVGGPEPKLFKAAMFLVLAVAVSFYHYMHFEMADAARNGTEFVAVLWAIVWPIGLCAIPAGVLRHVIHYPNGKASSQRRSA